ncbi:MAG: extracellular solute-binding protein, partial [Clostridiales bacterium]|nr:extracellular solute-binding protein [Clostridiales bacterium]
MNRFIARIAVFCSLLLISSILYSCSNSSPTATSKEDSSAQKSGALPASSQTTPVSGKEKLPFRITWKDYSGRGVAIKKIVDIYNLKSTGKYEIVVESGDEDITALEGLLSNNGDDRIYVLPYRYVQYFGDKGLLRDLSDDLLTDRELFYPEIWKLGTVEGDLFGIPWLGHSICLIYNRQILEKAGVSVEGISDLNGLVTALEAVEAGTAAKGIGLVGANHNDISWMVNQFIYGFGSRLVDETGKKVVVNNEKARSAIEYYKNVLGSHAQPSWLTDTGAEVMAHFRKQEIAFEFQGIWGVTDIEKNGSPFETGVINL